MRFLSLLLLVSLRGIAGELPVSMEIYDFSLLNRYDAATVTVLKGDAKKVFEVSPEGIARESTISDFRTTSASTVARYRLDPDADRPCATALLSELQRPALKRMLKTGYISRKLYDAVLAASDLWFPEQVRLLVTWSEMTLDEARQIFAGKIPWDRVMGAREPESNKTPKEGSDEEMEDWHPDRIWEWEHSWNTSRKLRIVRSFLMLGTGQVLDPQSHQLTTFPMAWENIPIHRKMSLQNRAAFPLTAEISRALSEPAPLPGDLRLPLEMAAHLMKAEADILGVPHDDYFVFARALSPAKSYYFQRAFGGRLFDLSVRTWFETSPQDARAHYRNAPIKKPEQEDTVVYCTLPSLLERTSLIDFSARTRELMTLSKGKLAAEQAQHLIGLHQNELRMAFDVHIPGVPAPKGPILVRNATPTPQAAVAALAVKYGVTDETALNEIVRQLTKFGAHELEQFGPYFLEPPVFTPTEFPEKAGIIVHNLSEEAAKAAPKRYLASVLYNVYAYYHDKFYDADDFEWHHLVESARMILEYKAQEQKIAPPDIGETSPEWLLKVFPFVVVTASEEVAEQLREMGGHLFPSVTLSFPSRPGYTVLFTGSTIREFAEKYPGAADLTQLRVGDYQKRYQLLISGQF